MQNNSAFPLDIIMAKSYNMSYGIFIKTEKVVRDKWLKQQKSN